MLQCVREGHDIVALANLKPKDTGTKKQGFLLTTPNDKIKNIMGLHERKPVFGFAKNKGPVQPAHQLSQIYPFVIRFLESIAKLATSKTVIFFVASLCS